MWITENWVWNMYLAENRFGREKICSVEGMWVTICEKEFLSKYHEIATNCKSLHKSYFLSVKMIGDDRPTASGGEGGGGGWLAQFNFAIQ